MNDFSRKADDLLERFMMITNTVGTQIQGMNSSIVKLHETNEKMKEEGENKFNKIDERFMDMEKKILDLDKKYENRGEDNKQENVIANQSETVITGLHSETTDSEVTVMLKEMMKEIGMDFESVKLLCLAKPITHAFIYFENDNERNKFIRSANMLKRELRGRKITSIKTWRPSLPDLLELDYQTCSSKGTDCGKDMSRWISQVQQVPRCGRRS